MFSGSVIGKGGENVKRLSNRSGARVLVRAERGSAAGGYVEVSGYGQALEVAQQLLQQQFDAFLSTGEARRLMKTYEPRSVLVLRGGTRPPTREVKLCPSCRQYCTRLHAAPSHGGGARRAMYTQTCSARSGPMQAVPTPTPWWCITSWALHLAPARGRPSHLLPGKVRKANASNAHMLQYACRKPRLGTACPSRARHCVGLGTGIAAWRPGCLQGRRAHLAALHTFPAP